MCTSLLVEAVITVRYYIVSIIRSEYVFLSSTMVCASITIVIAFAASGTSFALSLVSSLRCDM